MRASAAFFQGTRHLKLALVVAPLAGLLIGGGVAYATTAAAARPRSLYGCAKSNVVTGKLTTDPQKCPKGYTQIVAAARGQRGPQGPSGIVSTSQTELVHLTDPNSLGDGDLIEAGGPTVLPQKITLTSGTWLLTADFSATPFSRDSLPDGQIFPQMTVRADDSPVFTVGSGGLVQLTTVHEGGITSYYSGTYQITVPASGTVLSFSFVGLVMTSSLTVGTDFYDLNGATLTATRLRA